MMTKMILVLKVILLSMQYVVVDAKATPCNSCECQFDCSKEKESPACGVGDSSMTTFKNKCELSLEKCKSGKVLFVYDGECKMKCAGVKCPAGQSCVFDQDGYSVCIKSDCEEVVAQSCPTDGAPVCGLDNITYDSGCHLKQTACKTNQILLKRYDGTCEKKKTCKDVTCKKGEACVTTSEGTPRCIECCSTKKKSIVSISMCGSDGQKYSSWCQMRAASCKSGKEIEIVDWQKEDCSKPAKKDGDKS